MPLRISDQSFSPKNGDLVVAKVLDRLSAETIQHPLREANPSDLLLSMLLGVGGAALALNDVARKGRRIRKLGALQEARELLEGTAMQAIRLLRALPQNLDRGKGKRNRPCS